MSRVGEWLRSAAVIALGLFAGAMLTEGGVLVPYWRSLPAEQFFTWYAENDERLLAFFSPLTIVAALLAIAAAAASLWTAHRGRWFFVVAAVLMVGIVLMFPLYFQGANASFSAASLAPDPLAAELTRWGSLHWVRTALAFVAFALAVFAPRR